MKHNDGELQALLRLARSCVKYERVPGEQGERGFFEKFEAEHAERSRQSEAELAERSLEQDDTITQEDPKVDMLLELSPPLEAPGEDPPDARTLRLQTTQLEHTLTEARQLLEAATKELQQEVLKRMRLETEERTAEEALRKSQHQRRLAKDMVKRQNVEIKTLHSDVQMLKAAISQPPLLPQPPATGPGRPKATRPRPAAGRLAPAEDDATASISSPSVQTSKQAPRPPPALAASMILPPKSRTFSAVLASRPKDSNEWKTYIP